MNASMSAPIPSINKADNLILSSENLPGLLTQLKAVTAQCKANVNDLERLKSRIRR
jgi:hypothetical protein